MCLQNHIKNHPNFKNIVGKWHIDHIFPISAFVKYGIKDESIINSLDNLQPLSAKENLLKNDRYDTVKFEEWLKTKGVKI